MKYDVFVSYKSEEKDIAMSVVTQLEKRGVKCWIAPRDIPVSVSYAKIAPRMAGSTDALILILTKASQDSPHVTAEVNRAFGGKHAIFPYQFGDFELSEEMAYFLSFSQITKQENELIEGVVQFFNRENRDGGYGKGGGMVQVDGRLQAALNASGINYAVDNDGDFQTEWPFAYNGQVCHTFVELLSKTSFISDGVYRTVSGYFRLRGDRRVIADVLQSSNVKWQLKEEQQGQYFVCCSFLISPDANGAMLRNVCQNIAEILQKTIIAILQYNTSEGGWLSKIGKAIGVGVAALAGLGAIAAVSSGDE